MVRFRQLPGTEQRSPPATQGAGRAMHSTSSGRGVPLNLGHLIASKADEVGRYHLPQFFQLFRSRRLAFQGQRSIEGSQPAFSDGEGEQPVGFTPIRFDLVAEVFAQAVDQTARVIGGYVSVHKRHNNLRGFSEHWRATGGPPAQWVGPANSVQYGLQCRRCGPAAPALAPVPGCPARLARPVTTPEPDRNSAGPD